MNNRTHNPNTEHFRQEWKADMQYLLDNFDAIPTRALTRSREVMGVKLKCKLDPNWLRLQAASEEAAP